MWKQSVWFGVLAAGMLGPPGITVAGEPGDGQQETAVEEAVFPMREVSILKTTLDRSLQNDLIQGARAICQEQPHEAVTAYPKLLSEKPIYGVIRLAQETYEKESGTAVYFVLDESGEDAAEDEEEAAPEAPKEENSLLDTIGAALGFTKPDKPVVPQQPELNNTYDRLYVDLNGDLDLTNDPVVKPMKEPPAGFSRSYSGLVQSVVFDEISVPLDFGEELGSRPVRLIPRMEIQEYEGKDYPGAEFISSVARQGSIKLGDASYRAVLAQRYLIGGRYDRESTTLLLTSASNPNRQAGWWGGDQLNAMHLVDGTYYTTSTTPLGDQLIVKPYDGPMGTFKLGPGDRKLDKLTIQGSLHTEKNVALAIGAQEASGSLKPVSECRLPVGDYIPNYVSLEFGNLGISISENYHSDGKPMAVDRDSWRYGIKIREGEPFVLDFSTPPEVMFASPAKDQRFKPGDEISVKGVLIDPKLTIMFRRMNDTSRMEEKTTDLGNGQTTTYKTQVSLDPIVTITNASGKQIAEGPMPFG